MDRVLIEGKGALLKPTFLGSFVKYAQRPEEILFSLRKNLPQPLWCTMNGHSYDVLEVPIFLRISTL
jgi:hypothetical protein